jgi:hypothetical protein
VVGSVKEERLGDREGRVQASFPFAQSPTTRSMTVVLRTALPAETVLASARREVLALDREQPLYVVRTLTDLRRRSLASACHAGMVPHGSGVSTQDRSGMDRSARLGHR